MPPGYVPGSGVLKPSGFGGFGERLLRKQGWQTGEGLGKDKSGRAEAIAVKKKEDNVGVSGNLVLAHPLTTRGLTRLRYNLQIGGNKVQFNTAKWWEGAFDTALDVINHNVSLTHPALQVGHGSTAFCQLVLLPV